jgi:hypothetical protein
MKRHRTRAVIATAVLVASAATVAGVALGTTGAGFASEIFDKESPEGRGA